MYQIGEFSRICQVSVKTLHHYDKLGLLKPAEVDRSTGYRYYDRSQLERMLLIQKLKRYGLSLEEILPLLLEGKGAEFRRVLEQQREKLRWQQMELGMVLQELTLHLQSLERNGEPMEVKGTYEIQLVEAPALTVLSCRQRMGVEEFGRYYGTLYERIARGGMTPDGVFGAMYHDTEFDRDASDVELFIGIREPEKADRVVPSRLCAKTLHRGTYSTLPEAYAALVSWIEENGFVWNDAPYDVYLKTAQNGYAPQDWETEIYFPVQKREPAETGGPQ